MDEPRFDPLDYVSVFNRRKWWFIVPVALAIVVGGAAGLELPRTYQATTTIAVSAGAPGAEPAGAVEMDRPGADARRLAAAPEPSVLERTARLEHLDQTARSTRQSAGPRQRQRVAARLDHAEPRPARRRQQLSPDQKAQLDTYQVSYVDATPDDAQRIVNRLAQVFVEENSRSREMRAQDTSQFIEGQLRASAAPPERARRPGCGR